MIQLPIDNQPSMSFSMNTSVGSFVFRTYWNPLLSMWYMDILDPQNNDLIDGIALTTGSNNLIAGNNVADLEGCALFVTDISGNGNTTFGGFGLTAFVFMTFPGDPPVMAYNG